MSELKSSRQLAKKLSGTFENIIILKKDEVLISSRKFKLFNYLKEITFLFLFKDF